MFTLLRKHPVISIISLLTLAFLVWGFWPQPVYVEAVEAERGPLTISIEEEGRTRVIDRYVISAPVNGVTCRQQLNVGDAIEQGQVLLNITPLESQALDPRSRAQAKAQVERAKSALHAAEEQARAATSAAQLASTELQRKQQLMKDSVISRDEFDKAVTESQTRDAVKRSTDFKVEVAQYELQSARTTLEYTAGKGDAANSERIPVRSPIKGRVLKVTRECEGPVNTGEALLEVGDPSALEVEVDVLSADAVKIKPGMKVMFDRWGGDKPLQGKVRIIEPVGFTKVSALGVEEQRVLVISEFVSPADQWQRLGDGYRVEAQFILWHEEEVLQIPASALFRYQGGWAVFVLHNNRAIRKIVKVGQRNGLVAQIIEGVTDGELVITHPSDEVDDNRSVKLRMVKVD